MTDIEQARSLAVSFRAAALAAFPVPVIMSDDDKAPFLSGTLDDAADVSQALAAISWGRTLDHEPTIADARDLMIGFFTEGFSSPDATHELILGGAWDDVMETRRALAAAQYGFAQEHA